MTAENIAHTLFYKTCLQQKKAQMQQKHKHDDQIGKVTAWI